MDSKFLKIIFEPYEFLLKASGSYEIAGLFDYLSRELVLGFDDPVIFGPCFQVFWNLF